MPATSSPPTGKPPTGARPPSGLPPRPTTPSGGGAASSSPSSPPSPLIPGTKSVSPLTPNRGSQANSRDGSGTNTPIGASAASGINSTAQQASWAGSGTNNPVDVMSPFTQASMTSLPTSDGGFSRQGSVLVPAGSNMVQGPDASLLQGTAASLQPASSNMAQGASTIQHRAGSNMLQGTAYLLQPASSNMAQGAAAILQPAGSNMAQGTAASTLSAISSVQAPSMSGLVQSQSRALQPAGSNMAQGPSEPMKNLMQPGAAQPGYGGAAGRYADVRQSEADFNNQPLKQSSRNSALRNSAQPEDPRSDFQAVSGTGPAELQEVQYNHRPYLMDHKTKTVFKEVVNGNAPEPLGKWEVQYNHRPYLMDYKTKTVFKEVVNGNAPEPVGKWVQGRVVFTPPTNEMDLYNALASYIQSKGLALEDVFAVRDADLDGALSLSEALRLFMEVLPNAPTSEVHYFLALADFDADGFIYLEDLQPAGEECFVVAAELQLGPASALVVSLQQAGEECFAVAAELQLGPASALVVSLQQAGEECFVVAAELQLGPASALVASLQVYILSHLYDKPGDNRKTLNEMLNTLAMADESYTVAARKGLGHATSLAAGRPVANHQLPAAVTILKRSGMPAGGEQHADVDYGGAGTRRTNNPRSAVTDFFAILLAHMKRHKVSLKELLRRCDTTGDGQLRPDETRRFVRSIVPTVTEAQMVYIKNVNRHSAIISTAAATEGIPIRGPVDAIFIIADHMRKSRMKLDTLFTQFDANGNGLLSLSELLRLMRQCDPQLRDRDLDLCVQQLQQYAQEDNKFQVSLQVPIEQQDPSYLPGLPPIADHLGLQTGDPADPFSAAHAKAWGPSTPDPSMGKNDWIRMKANDPAMEMAGFSIPDPGMGKNDWIRMKANDPAMEMVRKLSAVNLEPMIYIGHQYFMDPLSKLVFLPTSKVASASMPEASEEESRSKRGGTNGRRSQTIGSIDSLNGKPKP
eukprot:gene18034-24448_t